MLPLHFPTINEALSSSILGQPRHSAPLPQQGEYLGGAIAPGLKTAADSLHLKTAKLPKVDLAIPDSVIGRDTATSMQSGIMFGYAGLVDAIVKRIQKDIGQSTLRPRHRRPGFHNHPNFPDDSRS